MGFSAEAFARWRNNRSSSLFMQTRTICHCKFKFTEAGPDWSVKTISRFDSSAKFLFSRCHGNENFRIQLIIFYNLIIIQV